MDSPKHNEDTEMMKFIENVGNGSTTAYRENGRKIGGNVNAAAYISGKGVVVQLESNGSWVPKTTKKRFDTEGDYEKWKNDLSENGVLFIKAIESFGATTIFSGKTENG